jgi:hypothetical protein
MDVALARVDTLSMDVAGRDGRGGRDGDSRTVRPFNERVHVQV